MFAICDQEDKGFVTKRDMQRLKDELPLQPDQLENVFDALDQDQNGYLTLEEFTRGFEGFLGLEPPEKDQVIILFSLLTADNTFTGHATHFLFYSKNFMEVLRT